MTGRKGSARRFDGMYHGQTSSTLAGKAGVSGSKYNDLAGQKRQDRFESALNSVGPADFR